MLGNVTTMRKRPKVFMSASVMLIQSQMEEEASRKELVTMRRFHREVKRYRVDNERIMKAQEEILPSLNMLHKQVNKDSGTKQEISGKKVSTYRSHRKRDDHINDRKSRSMRSRHHSSRNSTRRTRKKPKCVSFFKEKKKA
jgi:hypothetical protein